MARHSTISSDTKNLLLIGYRCTGKSTVARLLATWLDWGWTDADTVLEERAGTTIRAIFAAEGEAGFRQREEAVLDELCRGQRQVIATGGGVVLSSRNRQRLREAGRVIWLTADADTIWQRLQTDGSTRDRRPTLTVGGLAEIQELLRVREPLYRSCADIIVETASRSPEDVANHVLEKLAPAREDGST
jgi:shikimate kinase